MKHRCGAELWDDSKAWQCLKGRLLNFCWVTPAPTAVWGASALWVSRGPLLRITPSKAQPWPAMWCF